MSSTVSLADLLSPENIAVDHPATGKHELLGTLSAKAAAYAQLPAEVVQTALDKREALGSTGMGGGIAVPHARLPGLARPFGLMVRLRKPIDFDAVDGEPVDIVFLLLLPEPGSTQALAMVARKLRDRSLLEKFRSAKDARELHALIAGPG